MSHGLNVTLSIEVDFVIVTDGRMTPIEVKSGKSGTLKSLSQFSYSKNAGTAIRFDLNRYSVQSVSNKINVGGKVHPAEYKLMSYPLYAVSLLST